MSANACPFRIDIPAARLGRITSQLADMRWPSAPADDTGWRYGTELVFLQSLVAHWCKQYDWRAAEATLNRTSPRSERTSLPDMTTLPASSSLRPMICWMKARPRNITRELDRSST